VSAGSGWVARATRKAEHAVVLIGSGVAKPASKRLPRRTRRTTEGHGELAYRQGKSILGSIGIKKPSSNGQYGPRCRFCDHHSFAQPKLRKPRSYARVAAGFCRRRLLRKTVIPAPPLLLSLCISVVLRVLRVENRTRLHHARPAPDHAGVSLTGRLDRPRRVLL
jgi:hypothetical protein